MFSLILVRAASNETVELKAVFEAGGLILCLRKHVSVLKLLHVVTLVSLKDWSRIRKHFQGYVHTFEQLWLGHLLVTATKVLRQINQRQVNTAISRVDCLKNFEILRTGLRVCEQKVVLCPDRHVKYHLVVQSSGALSDRLEVLRVFVFNMLILVLLWDLS